MALEKIEEQVTTNGRTEAEGIAKEAKAQVNAIMAEARTEAEKVKIKELENAHQQVDKLRQRDLSAANLEVKKLRLNAEKNVLARVKESFFNELREMPKPKREAALRKLASRGTFSNGRVYSSEPDTELVKKVTKLEYGGSIDCLGGLVIESEDASISLVFTFDTIAEEVWSANNKKVYDLLFD